LEFLSLGRLLSNDEPDGQEIFRRKKIKPLFTLTVRMARQKKVYTRKSFNFNEWLDHTGGLIEVIDIFFIGMVIFFTAREYNSNFVRETWHVKGDDKKDG
jgi:hypothetical protein